jgi:hypothetical protein
MTNAKAIATAVQSVYVKNAGSVKYNTAPLSDATGDVLKDLGGTVPQNPCNAAGVGLLGYTVATTATSYSITPKNTDNCVAANITAITLSE